MVIQVDEFPDLPPGYKYIPVLEEDPELPEGYKLVPVETEKETSYLPKSPYFAESVEDFTESGLDTMTFGLTRPLKTLAVTAADYGLNPDTGESFLDRYRKAGDFVMKREEARQARSPVASLAGNVVGGTVIGGKLVPASASTSASKAVSQVGKLGRGVLAGTAIGGATAGADELTKQVAQGEISPGEVGAKSLQGATLGGGVTAVAGPVIYGVQNLLGATAKRLPSGLVAIPGIVRGMEVVKNIARTKKDLENLLRLGKRQGASTVLDIQSPTVAEAVSAVGATPAGSRLESDLINRSVNRNPSISGKAGVKKDRFLSNEITTTGKLAKIDKDLSDKYRDLDGVMAKGGNNITREDIQAVLNQDEMSVLEGFIATIKRTDPISSIQGTIETGLSPLMIDSVIQGPLSQAAKFGPTSVMAKDMIQKLRSIVDKKYPGFVQRSKDYAARYEYEAGAKAFKPGMSSAEYKAVKKTLSPMEDLGFRDSEAEHYLDLVSPSSAAANVIRGQTATAELVGRTGSGAVYSAPAAAGQGLRGFLDVKGRFRRKQMPNDVADFLQLSPEQALEYLRNRGVYKPGTYIVPTIQGYGQFNKEEE